MEKGEFQEAIDDFTREIRINPDYVGAYINRGIAYQDLGKYQEAIADYNTAIKINPNEADAYYNRGYVYSSNLEKYQEAIDDYTSAIKINPDYALAYNNRGVAKEKLGRDGCDDYKKACDLGESLGCQNYENVCN